jgi:hypothetical protein
VVKNGVEPPYSIKWPASDAALKPIRHCPSLHHEIEHGRVVHVMYLGAG